MYLKGVWPGWSRGKGGKGYSRGRLRCLFLGKNGYLWNVQKRKISCAGVMINSGLFHPPMAWVGLGFSFYFLSCVFFVLVRFFLCLFGSISWEYTLHIHGTSCVGVVLLFAYSGLCSRRLSLAPSYSSSCHDSLSPSPSPIISYVTSISGLVTTIGYPIGEEYNLEEWTSRRTPRIERSINS